MLGVVELSLGLTNVVCSVQDNEFGALVGWFNDYVLVGFKTFQGRPLLPGEVAPGEAAISQMVKGLLALLFWLGSRLGEGVPLGEGEMEKEPGSEEKLILGTEGRGFGLDLGEGSVH